MPAPVNAPLQEIVMYDDGCGVAISDSNGVYVTHDHWESTTKVDLPAVDAPTEFVPRSVDTTATGTVIVAGFIWRRKTYGPIFTYAIRSSDHGRTWEEIGTRRLGRYQSMSFRGGEEGLIVYEYIKLRENNTYDTVEITVERIDENFVVRSATVLRSLAAIKRGCNYGHDTETHVITSLGSNGALLSIVSPCYVIQDPPTSDRFYGTLYRSKRLGEDFNVVSSLPVEVDPYPYRGSYIKEAVLGDSMYTGLNYNVTLDNGNSWTDKGYSYVRIPTTRTDTSYVRSWVSDTRNGQFATSSRYYESDTSTLTTYAMILVSMSDFKGSTIGTVRFANPFRNLETKRWFNSRRVFYGRDGIIRAEYESCYLTKKYDTTIDSLFLFVLKPSSVTSAPSLHTIEQLVPDIRVTASTIHVRMPMRTQMDRTLRIVDVTGREIRSHDVATENEEFYIGGLTPGMYYAYMPGVRAVPFCNP